jgi:hypothetical protein
MFPIGNQGAAAITNTLALPPFFLQLQNITNQTFNCFLDSTQSNQDPVVGLYNNVFGYLKGLHAFQKMVNLKANDNVHIITTPIPNPAQPQQLPLKPPQRSEIYSLWYLSTTYLTFKPMADYFPYIILMIENFSKFLFPPIQLKTAVPTVQDPADNPLQRTNLDYQVCHFNITLTTLLQQVVISPGAPTTPSPSFGPLHDQRSKEVFVSTTYAGKDLGVIRDYSPQITDPNGRIYNPASPPPSSQLQYSYSLAPKLQSSQSRQSPLTRNTVTPMYNIRPPIFPLSTFQLPSIETRKDGFLYQKMPLQGTSVQPSSRRRPIRVGGRHLYREWDYNPLFVENFENLDRFKDRIFAAKQFVSLMIPSKNDQNGLKSEQEQWYYVFYNIIDLYSNTPIYDINTTTRFRDWLAQIKPKAL